MRYVLFAIALAASTAAAAQTAYTPPEVRITRTDVRSENQADGVNTCFVGTIRVSKHDDVTITLQSCPAEDGSVRSVSTTNQRGGITAGRIGNVTVTNSPGAITGATLNIDRVEMGGGTVTITGVSGGMATSGIEEAVVRSCLDQARSMRANRNRGYLKCLQARLGPEGFAVSY